MLDYNRHDTLLLSAVTGYDSHFASAPARITRKFHNAELGGSNFELDSPSDAIEDLDCDADASATMLLADMNNRGNSNSDSYLLSED